MSVRASFTTFQDGQIEMELKEDKEGGITEILDGGKARFIRRISVASTAIQTAHY